MKKAYKFHPYIDDWINKVEKGLVHSCKEMKLLVKFIKKELSKKDVVIKEDEINKAVEFMEKYFFPLYDAELFIVALIVGVFHRFGDQLFFNQIFIMAGRGFGKNGLISALSLYFISEYHGVYKYNVDIVANSEEQATTSFNDVYEAIEDRLGKARAKQLFDYNKEHIKYRKTRADLRYRTSNGDTKDGGRPGVVIFDEVHAYKNYDNIKVFTGGLGKVPRPRRVYITTDGEVREGVLDNFKERARKVLVGEIEHNGFLPIIFKLDSLQEVGKKELWDKANPRINLSPDLKHEIEIEYEEMLYDASLKEAFISKRMNIPFADTNYYVTTWDNIMACSDHKWDIEKGADCIGSIDYAELIDWASVGLRFKKNGKQYFMQHTFIHETSLKLTKYDINIDEAVEKGWATIVYENESPTIPAQYIADWFIKYASEYNIIDIKCDLFKTQLLNSIFEQYGLPLSVIRNGDVTHNKVAPVIRNLFANKELVLQDDKLMRFFIWNTKLIKNKKGNMTFEKWEKFKKKNDGFMALVHSLAEDTLQEGQEMEFFEPTVF